MTRGKTHYKENIHENAYVTYYAATNAAMIEYPFLVGRYDESSPTLASKAEEYILDSAIGDPSVGNEDVLDRADDIGTGVVVAADVMNDPETTTERIVEMLELVDERETDYEVLVPLQFDDDTSHVDHYEDVRHRLDEHGYDITDYRLYVGGLIGISHDDAYREQIHRCIELREHVGTDVYLHGLGVGASREWVVAIRRCPWLLDSIDNSTIVQNLVYAGKLWTSDGAWVEVQMPRGSNSTVLAVEHVEAALNTYNYMVGSDIDERDALNTFEDADLAELVGEHERWHDAISAVEAIAD